MFVRHARAVLLVALWRDLCAVSLRRARLGTPSLWVWLSMNMGVSPGVVAAERDGSMVCAVDAFVR